MFETIDDQIKPDLPPRNNWQGQLVAFSMLSVMLALATAVNLYLQYRDASVAPRQQSVIGVITGKQTGRSSSVYYKYLFDGALYYDSESGSKGWDVGNKVVVYLDPDHPSTSGLIDFYASGNRHREAWHAFLAGSILSAAIALLCRPRAIARQKEMDAADDLES